MVIEYGHLGELSFLGNILGSNETSFCAGAEIPPDLFYHPHLLPAEELLFALV